MKSKAPLALMEELVMLAVFALAAALCLQAFVKSDQISRRAEAQDRAAVLCQSAAEAIRANNGDFSAAAEALGLPYDAYAGEGLAFEAHYNEDWTLSHTREYAYCLRAWPRDLAQEGLGGAAVEVVETGKQEAVFTLEINWQIPLAAADREETPFQKTPGDVEISQADRDRARLEAETLAGEIRESRGQYVGEGLSGETDGLGGWCRYFDADWNMTGYDRAVFTLWYSREKVVASWNQTDENGFVTGGNVSLCTVELEEVTAHD